MERVQLQVTKMSKLINLNQLSLEKRSLRGDLIQEFRIIKCFDILDLSSYLDLICLISLIVMVTKSLANVLS